MKKSNVYNHFLVQQSQDGLAQRAVLVQVPAAAITGGGGGGGGATLDEGHQAHQRV